MSKVRSKPQYDVLVATGSSGGTIAAVRELSKQKLNVTVISDKMFCPASWSRFAKRSYSGPPERESRAFLNLLLEIGADSPGQILLATSDETAWLYSRHAKSLSQYFRLHQPPIETLERILDKQFLGEAAIKAGLTVLPTWEPRTLSDIAALAPTLTYPILIKPRTQLHRTRNDKGIVATSTRELLESFQEFISLENEHAPDGLLPENKLPLLQQFVDTHKEGVYSVSGYIDTTGTLFVTRHAVKVFQRSQPAGVGVCFESLPPNAGLSEAVRRLCQELAYFGIFEVEFLKFDGSWAVIDFNPRLFNQAGMDARRGMSLPLFAYLDAAGKTAELAEAVASAQEKNSHRTIVFYDRFTLWAILMAKTLTRRISKDERRYWNSWVKRHMPNSVDFAFDIADPMPGLVHALAEIILGVKAIRRFIRSTPLVIPDHQGVPVKLIQ